ncbi:protoporphyrinogen oxidase HemJ [Helicobacter trogontum]|uniref:Protoporphyrinogen IX oxidase n=1 Tax=Helicobacter trogontum TaxID=50960 RepID=A0A4U8SBG5_9HELI|nr:protoporphyrinogen oxidase HemJ [Helicobacter trogontum]TLD83346.1 protoporphyrinogen oxidase HemJ [Helicobacter trogontum]
MLQDYYDYIKVFHIASVITWMAMLFYLPRLFVYHAEQYNNVAFRNVVELQEKRLYYAIGYPAMIAVLISGSLITLAVPGIMKSGGWIHAKFTLVLLLLVYHFCCGFYRKKLLESCYKSGRFFRIFNEIPTLFMLIIVYLVVLKPF